MKEYRLSAWPEHSPEFQRTGHRRVLSEMSSRYMTVIQLADVSGLKKNEVRAFIEMLDGRGLVNEREATVPESFLDSKSPLGWLRRAMTTSSDRR